MRCHQRPRLAAWSTCPEPFALSLSQGLPDVARGFDKLSPNGVQGAVRRCAPVELCGMHATPRTVRPEPVEGPARRGGGFDKLSPNGVRLSPSGRRGDHPHPFALSLSKGLHTMTRGFDKLSPNGVKLSPNGVKPSPNGVKPSPNGVKPSPNGVKPSPNAVQARPAPGQARSHWHP
jgi:hypothetical protein